MRSIPAAFALFLAIGSPLRAAELTFRLDPAASSVSFTLGATLHTVLGTFRFKEGEVRVEPASGRLEGRFVVDAKSGESGNEGRDKDMHEEVLESGKFPEIVFVPKRLEGTFDPARPGRVTVHGKLTLHGADHPLAVSVDLEPGPAGKLTARCTFTIPFVAWGLEDPSVFVMRVEKEVKVTVVVVGTLGS